MLTGDLLFYYKTPQVIVYRALYGGLHYEYTTVVFVISSKAITLHFL